MLPFLHWKYNEKVIKHPRGTMKKWWYRAKIIDENLVEILMYWCIIQYSTVNYRNICYVQNHTRYWKATTVPKSVCAINNKKQDNTYRSVPPCKTAKKLGTMEIQQVSCWACEQSCNCGSPIQGVHRHAFIHSRSSFWLSMLSMRTASLQTCS